ncbi:hypothetical protein B566_EDAN014671, partial [Ephemera danica]
MEFKHPFTGIVAGPTGSGKTYFVREFLNRKPVNVKFDEVIWCYGEWQSLYKEIKATFHEGLLDTLPSDDKPRLLVVDDLMHEADKRVVDLFTKGSHHRNISVLFITQNLFHQKSGARDISLNAHYMVIFKNPRDAAQIGYLGRQITPENPKFLPPCPSGMLQQTLPPKPTMPVLVRPPMLNWQKAPTLPPPRPITFGPPKPIMFGPPRLQITLAPPKFAVQLTAKPNQAKVVLTVATTGAPRTTENT